MDLIGAALSPIRAVLGAAEREAEDVLPVREIEEIQQRVLEGVQAVRSATESIESHVEVLETLATSLPPLTEAVTQLSVQLGEILQVIAPIAAAERGVATLGHDVEKAERFLFRRRHRGEDPPPPAPSAPAPPPAPPAE